MARPPREKFPNANVGDLVRNEHGTWSIVAPDYCPSGHPTTPGRVSVRGGACDCGQRHMTWTCECGAVTYAPKLGDECRTRSAPGSAYEDDQRGDVT
ncbi:MAG: hypothetical protein ACRDUS_08735 [Mycobacterium sp.]